MNDLATDLQALLKSLQEMNEELHGYKRLLAEYNEQIVNLELNALTGSRPEACKSVLKHML